MLTSPPELLRERLAAARRAGDDFADAWPLALTAAALAPTHNLEGLRHTFGTKCAAAGVAMRTLQEWMGHRGISTTQRYADYAPSTREAELIEAAFSASASGASLLYKGHHTEGRSGAQGQASASDHVG